MVSKTNDSEIEDDLVAMRRYARVLTRDTHDADDVVHDAIVHAIEGKRTYQPERSRRRWLLSIVHNVFISGKRKQAAESRRDERFAETLVSHLAPEQEQRARLSSIARTFAELPEAQRAVLHLTAVEGLSYQETADALNIPIGTVMSRIARARQTLRQAETAGQRTEPALRIVGGRDV